VYTALAPVIGAVITLMNDVNSRFSELAGILLATIVIHVVGLAVVSAVLLVRREETIRGRLPLPYYLGGFVGVGTVFSSMYAFSTLGASFAVALGLLGQMLFSVAVDATGFLGRTKYPLSPRGLPGIALAVAGVAVMVQDWRSDGPAMLVGLASGALPGLTFIFNSELGRKKGVFHSTRINYIVGLSTILLVVAVLRPPADTVGKAAEALRAAGAAAPFLVLGGGVTGVIVVSGINFIFPRIPAFSATLLMFAGQAMTGVTIDAIATGACDARRVAGTAVLLAGLAVNGLLARRREKPGMRHARG
jgi:transporter family-2 protein